MDALAVVLRFVELVNAAEVDGLAECLTGDHALIDSLGVEVVGRVAVRDAWLRYFEMVPGYEIEVAEQFVNGDVVVLVGRAGGYWGERDPEREWAVPAAWRAVVRGGRVAEWQVFADNEPLRELIARFPV